MNTTLKARLKSYFFFTLAFVSMAVGALSLIPKTAFLAVVGIALIIVTFPLLFFGFLYLSDYRAHRKNEEQDKRYLDEMRHSGAI